MSLIRIIPILLFFSISAISSLAKVSSPFDLVIKGCEKLSYAQWIKRYDETENRVIEAFQKNPKLSVGDEKEFFEVVFPQDLPKIHPMKSAFIGCFEIFEEYQKAKNNVQSMNARKRLESCYQDAYKIDPPKELARYMTCLKKIKY